MILTVIRTIGRCILIIFMIAVIAVGFDYANRVTGYLGRGFDGWTAAKWAQEDLVRDMARHIEINQTGSKGEIEVQYHINDFVEILPCVKLGEGH